MRGIGAALLLGVMGLLSTCGEERAAPADGNGRPAGEERLLVVDGIEITFGDLAPHVAFLHRYYPVYSERTKIRTVLDEYLLPLVLARRDFPAERREQLQRAQGLASVAGNVAELEQQSSLLRGVRQQVQPRKLEIAVAAFLFDATRLGSVSAPIELPQGYVIAAAFDLQTAAIGADDRADALQVPFFNLDRDAYFQWLERRKREVADKVTWLHPDYVDALPNWLQAPPPNRSPR